MGWIFNRESDLELGQSQDCDLTSQKLNQDLILWAITEHTGD